MTVKEYLHQAYRLDQRIKSDTMEAQNLREMAGSVSAIQYDKDRVQTSRNTEAPFARTLEKLWELEQKIARELEMLSDLKKQIREVIEEVPDTDERMVLKYRYIHNYTWEQIGTELCADARTMEEVTKTLQAEATSVGEGMEVIQVTRERWIYRVFYVSERPFADGNCFPNTLKAFHAIYRDKIIVLRHIKDQDGHAVTTEEFHKRRR